VLEESDLTVRQRDRVSVRSEVAAGQSGSLILLKALVRGSSLKS